MWNSQTWREWELIQQKKSDSFWWRQDTDNIGPDIEAFDLGILLTQDFYHESREVSTWEPVFDLSIDSWLVHLCLCKASVLIVLAFVKVSWDLRCAVRRVPSIPLSQLLISASRWCDRCPPQPELSSKNGLTLETWIFIFSDNCTMSGHIRLGLMRNRLRAGTDAEWSEMERGLESTQGQRWKRNENENFPNIFIKKED